MATYAIGDIQGCYDEFTRLLSLLHFEPHQDTLWLTGDLVNRGPHSLEVLRLVRSFGARCITVLGNHDLHLLARRHLPQRKAKTGDTLEPILSAPDGDELIDWLRRQPLFHHDERLGFALVHAGLAPAWTIAETMRHAAEVEAALRSRSFKKFLEEMYGNEPSHWRSDLAGYPRLRFIANCLTRARYCTADQRFNFKAKGGLGQEAPALLPWFMLPDRASHTTRIVIGHWSTLRMTSSQQAKYHLYPLDTGAVWGGELTAMRLDDGAYFSIKAAAASRSED